MDGDQSAQTTPSKAKRIRIAVLSAALIIAVAIGGFVVLNNRAPSEKFCTMALGFGTVHGIQVVWQDQGGPGKDGCDLPDHGEYTDVGPTLGFDCKVRDASGKVVDSVPKAADGTCRADG